MEVQTAEWREREYPPTMQQRIYRVLCWILGLAFYFSFLFNYPYRLEALTCFGVLLVIIQFFSGSLKPIETAMKNLMRQYWDKNALPVWITINRGDLEPVSDRGAMWTQDGWLIFRGLETELRIPRAAEIRLTETHWPVGWLIEFETAEGPIKIDISKTYSKPQIKDLNKLLEDLLRQWEQNESVPIDVVATLPFPPVSCSSNKSDTKFRLKAGTLYFGGLAVLCLAIWFFPDQLAYRLEKPFVFMVLGVPLCQWVLKNGDRELHFRNARSRKNANNANP